MNTPNNELNREQLIVCFEDHAKKFPEYFDREHLEIFYNFIDEDIKVLLDFFRNTDKDQSRVQRILNILISIEEILNPMSRDECIKKIQNAREK